MSLVENIYNLHIAAEPVAHSQILVESRRARRSLDFLTASEYFPLTRSSNIT